MSEAIQERADIAARRSSTWWLLSRLVTEAPTAAWINELAATLARAPVDPTDALGLETADLLLAVQAVRAQTDGLIELAVDRTRLLAGVIKNDALPAPYESTALGLEMNSDRVLGLIETYAEAGFDDLAPELGPPDFLGTELRFMALLCFKELQALQRDDIDGAATWLTRQQRFLDDNLLAWVPAHCEHLAAQAATPLYQAVARLLGHACAMDREDVGILMAPAG